jgi:beta-lactamase class A
VRRILLLSCLVWLAASVAAANLPGQNPPAVSPTDSIASFAFPPKDAALQRALESVLAGAPFARHVARGQLSVVLVDLSTPGVIRFAGIDEDRMRYSASLPKIAVMLAVFEQIDHGRLEYTPALREELEGMIRRSENRTASDLIRLVGFDAIESVLRDPHYDLYDPDRNGGLWVGKGYGGIGVWRRDPMHQISHGATARQVARFLVMLDQGLLISPAASAEMKRIMGHPEIEHKFVLGLRDRAGLMIFRKSGTYKRWHADAAIVEYPDHKYIAVGLLESTQWRGVLSTLIDRLDDIIIQSQAPTLAPPKLSHNGPEPVSARPACRTGWCRSTPSSRSVVGFVASRSSWADTARWNTPSSVCLNHASLSAP